MKKRRETRVSHNIRYYMHAHECDGEPERTDFEKWHNAFDNIFG